MEPADGAENRIDRSVALDLELESPQNGLDPFDELAAVSGCFVHESIS